ncbi:long-chain fatty acid--CoA ligase [Streptomyces cavourensis]|nr:long-chain fatty acid--CoA ligase [Streptomyces cavourensis]
MYVDETHTQVPISWSDLRRQVGALAAELRALGVTPGDRVSGYLPNIPQAVVAFLATAAVGGVWTSCAPDFGARSVLDRFQQIEPVVLFTVDGYRYGGKEHDRTETVAELRRELPTLRAVVHIPLLGTDAPEGALAWAALTSADTEPIFEQVPFDHPLWVLYSSGTTGLPKGVMQPYHAWNAGIINQITNWGLTPDDRYVVAAPVTHGTGTYLLPVLASGGAHVLLEAATPAAITAAFRERGGTLSFMPPTLIYMIMAQPGVSRADFPRLRNLIYGGAPMPPEKIERARAFFGPVLGTTYGQTEAPQIVTVLRPADLDAPENRASVGRVTWLSDVAIMAPDGALLPRGEIGEVVVRGDLVMSGYWRLPEKTAETVIDGWLHTGDTGLIDPRGYLFLKDRLRDVIITGGFNVYPVDVENALSAHPAVYECSVFGLPDDKWGEAVHAAVQFHPGATADADALKAHVRGLLGPVATPKQFHIHDSLPRSPVGKVLKNAVRDAALKETP